MPALHDPVPRAPAEAPPPAPSDVYLYDTLAAGRRLWVRGRVAAPETVPPARRRGWWKRLRRRGAAPAPTPLVRVRTEVGGTALQADVALRREGYFEARFEADLP